MQLDDLPLFASGAPATIIVFPLERRVGKVRRTAQLLSERHGDEAALYWKQVVSSTRRSLERVGLPDVDIEAEILTFRDAVQVELNRITCGARSPAGAS